jgi:hypothetical protein
MRGDWPHSKIMMSGNGLRRDGASTVLRGSTLQT